MALPVLKRIQKERGATVKKILIPFTDGKKQIGVVCNLEKAIESNGDLLILEMQKIITLKSLRQNLFLVKKINLQKISCLILDSRNKINFGYTI